LPRSFTFAITAGLQYINGISRELKGMSSRIDKLRKLNEQEADLRKRGLSGMAGRGDVERELQLIEAELRELIIGYEQYFMGVDKFEPAKERQVLALRLRRLVNLYIPQADLRFRLQGLAGRLQSYTAYWDRTLRLIEEGRYVRQRSHVQWAEQQPPGEPAVAPADALERVCRELGEAYARCQLPAPARAQVEAFLNRQAAAIQERFGDRPVDMVVVIEDGKPKLRVRSRGD
jgi:hypothetical protein